MFANLRASSPSAKASDQPPPVLVTISEMVDLRDASTLYGAVERCVATESVVFLVSVLKANVTLMADLLPPAESFRANELVTYATDVSEEFRSYMYRNVAPFLLPLEPFMEELSVCKWDLRDMPSKANDYVHLIIIAMKNSEKQVKDLGGLPASVMTTLWGEVCVYITEKLVQGYSHVRKCTTEGRALMSLDLSVLRHELEQTTGLSPVPSWDFVNDYVIAFYLPAADYLKWMDEHPSYSHQQYSSVAMLGPATHMKRKEKADFLKQVKLRFDAIQQTKLLARKRAQTSTSSDLN